MIRGNTMTASLASFVILGHVWASLALWNRWWETPDSELQSDQLTTGPINIQNFIGNCM